jgi:hypothetical protein
MACGRLGKHLSVVVLGLAVGVLSLPALAHHSYAAYDANRTRTLEGTIRTYQWANPHVVLRMLVSPEGHREPQEWRIETSSPAILRRFGWTRHSLKPGDRVSVICNPLSDGSYGGRLHTLVLLQSNQTLRTKLSDSAPAPPR